MSFFDDDDGRDTDLDETEPGERRPRRGRPGVRPRPRPRPRGPRRGGGGGAAVLQQPAARLLVAVAAIVILIVVIALVVRDCRRSQLVDSYRSYIIEGVTPVASKSADEGKKLLALLANQKGDKAENVQRDVRAIGREAATLVTQAEGLNPPDKLGEAHRSLVTALKYRVNGIEALAAEIPNAVKSSDRADAAAKIATTMQRILASDVIYADSFVGPARQALEDDNVDGVEVPESALLADSTAANGAGPAGARLILTNLKRGTAATTTDGTTPATGLHGTGIVSVKVLPSGKELVNGQVNEVPGSAENKWEVTIENGGGFVENGIDITATLKSASGAPQISKATVDSIDPGETKAVPLEVGTPPAFGENATLTIDVDKVPGEERTSNNTGTYTVKFTIQ
jgi:hypothetical protein